MERVTVFIDGLNFYYGLKRKMVLDSDWRKFYWLDIYNLFNLFMRSYQNLQRVYYFTTPPDNELKKQRHRALLNANVLLNGNKFRYVFGKYIEKTLICPECGSQYTVPEEKRTDVNISVHMMGDCAKNNTDTLILVTADSDLIPTLKYIRNNHPEKKVKVFFPPTGFSNDINSYVKNYNERVIMLDHNKGKFLSSIMPDTVSVGTNFVTIPSEWQV